MNKAYLLISLLIISICTHAVERAVTTTGEEVLLHKNGTWEYVDKTVEKSKKIPMNGKAFKKVKTSSFQVKSKTNSAVFFINPKKWAFKSSNDVNDAAEYTFELRNKDLYGMAITEEVEIELEALADIALENAQDFAPDTKIIKKEYRKVNGQKVIYLEMQGTGQGIKFSYFGYYFSNSKGSTQFLAYTGTSVAKKYKKEIDEFLNGLVIK